MIYDYTASEFLPDGAKKIKILYHPLLRVTLIKRGFKILPPPLCLIDSGADAIIFPSEVADYFQIKYKNFTRIPTNTAGGSSIDLFEVPYEAHGVDLFIEDVRVKEKISFSEGQQIPLLGQDFFRNFKITFDRLNKNFSLEASA